jgi:hypothetical protein
VCSFEPRVGRASWQSQIRSWLTNITTILPAGIPVGRHDATEDPQKATRRPERKGRFASPAHVVAEAAEIQPALDHPQGVHDHDPGFGVASILGLSISPIPNRWRRFGYRKRSHRRYSRRSCCGSGRMSAAVTDQVDHRRFNRLANTSVVHIWSIRQRVERCPNGLPCIEAIQQLRIDVGFPADRRRISEVLRDRLHRPPRRHLPGCLRHLRTSRSHFGQLDRAEDGS